MANDRATAAATCGMDRQTLRDWVHRYNAEGLAGLENRAVPHRPRRLAPAQMAALAAWVEAGPDPARDGVVRWRCRDLQRRIAAVFGVVLHERERRPSNWRHWASGGCRCARSTRSRTRRRKKRSKKLPRSGSRRDPGAGTGQAA